MTGLYDSDKAFAEALERLSKEVDRMYLEAIARVWGVHFNTVLIWRIAGRI